MVIRSLNSEVTRLFDTDKVYYTGYTKNLYTVIIRCVCKIFSLANHKMIATNKGQYIAQVLTDETIDSAVTNKRTYDASPS